MSIPSSYPQYITTIADPQDQLKWKSHYLQAYEQEYHELNNQWNGLKATMYGVSLLALTTFATIMMATAPLSIPLVVASCITLGAIGGTGAICVIVFYSCLAEENAKKRKDLSEKFPVKFEITFQQTRLNEELIKRQSSMNLYPQQVYPSAPSY
jgi:hypothetical protein